MFLLLSALVVLTAAQSPTSSGEGGRSYWERLAREDLEESLKVKLNTGTAKNVILFIGDGMGPNTITAARIYKGGEESYLFWERFPHVGALKTYATNRQVPDSANTATALFTGVKTNMNTLGVDDRVLRGDCEGSLQKEKRLTSLASLAQEAGKATGIVTTTRLTHATPAGMYAHSSARNWECDTSIPKSGAKCKDIARQLFEDSPGKNFNVIMGGGRYMMKTNESRTPDDPLDKYCLRRDGRDLIKEWEEDKKAKGLRFRLANDTKSLHTVMPSKTDYLLGIFANNHMTMDYERDKSEKGTPSLAEMATTAVEVLMNNKKGFLLMVESGLIDMAHHMGKARKALQEVLSLNDAINATTQLLEKAGILDETLIIVTSDHAHTLTISGYPEKGNSILGLAGKGLDGIPYTTLGYANSGKNNFHYRVQDNTVTREDPRKEDTTSFEYGAQAAVLREQNTHGGSDVFVYAKGPYAHLFHRMHEQNYVATVVKYAAKLGEFANVLNTEG